MNVVRQGYRMVFDSNAVAFDHVLQSRRQKFVRKARTITGNFQLLARAPAPGSAAESDLVPNGAQKGMRLVAPIAMLWLLGLSAALAPASWLYAGALGPRLRSTCSRCWASYSRRSAGPTGRECVLDFCVLNATTLFQPLPFPHTASERDLGARGLSIGRAGESVSPADDRKQGALPAWTVSCRPVTGDALAGTHRGWTRRGRRRVPARPRPARTAAQRRPRSS